METRTVPPTTTDNDEVFSREQAARFLNVSVATLAGWGVEGRGPEFSRTGPTRGRVLYRRSSLVRFLERTVVTRSGS